MADKSTPSRAQLIAAFAAIYLIWGSTYLAIRFAIDTIPPFLMAGSRFLLAGAILYAVATWQGAPRPTGQQWRSTAIIGALLLLGGNGGVVWSETRVPSGLAALMVATVPFWIVILDWLRPGGARPAGRVLFGIFLGMAGIFLLIGPGKSGGNVDMIGALALMIGSLSWSIGSLYSRQASLPQSPLLATGMEMLAGGSLLLLAGAATGEAGRLQLEAITARSALSLLYLVLFGSLIGFTAYIWLLRVAPAARVATYAYVNPVVAVFLGWAFANEKLSLQTIVASVVIIGAVMIITTYRAGPAKGAAPAAPDEALAADAPPEPSRPALRQSKA
jgi:drug/metabolite transporter (DMT)-like permease